MKHAALRQHWRQLGIVASEYNSWALFNIGKKSFEVTFQHYFVG